jgi:glycosyltransferase involved in cell wall biosynthesis
MKVLVFLATVGRGGVTRVIETLLPAVKTLGVEMEILGQSFNEIGDVVKYPEGVPFTQIRPIGKLPSHKDGQFDYLIAHSQEFVDHALEMEKDFDLVWCITPFWSLGNAEDAPFTKPVVINIPDFAFDHINMGDKLTSFFRLASTELALRADHTIFSSHFQRDWGVNHYGFKSTSVIPYSIFFSPKTNGDKIHPYIPEQYLLAMHPMGHKGLDVMLNAYRYAKSKLGNRIPPLVLAGLGTGELNNPYNDSFEVRKFWSHITKTGLRINRDVFCAGYVEEEAIPNLYKNANAVLTATKSEGDLSGVIHESILYKRPFIYSDLPVFRERIAHGVHGLAFPVGDYEAMGECIIETIVNPEMASLRSECAYEQLSSRTVEHVAQDFVDCFERVLCP